MAPQEASCKLEPTSPLTSPPPALKFQKKKTTFARLLWGKCVFLLSLLTQLLATASLTSELAAGSAGTGESAYATAGPHFASYLANELGDERNFYSLQQDGSCLLELARKPEVCITQQDVERTLEEAKAELANSQTVPHTSASSSQTLALISGAEVLARTSQLLAQQFHLSETEILYDLPQISAQSSGALSRFCGALFLQAGNELNQCSSATGEADHSNEVGGRLQSATTSRPTFRTLDGTCNNVNARSLGAARSQMERFLAPGFGDSLATPRTHSLSNDGSLLPSARVVSFVIHQERAACDTRHSMLGVVWGQFINHDINLGVRISDELEPLKGLDCCALASELERYQSDNSRKHDDLLQSAASKHCFPIEIPTGDPFYGHFAKKCMNFVRLAAAPRDNCALGPAAPMNKHTSFLDGSSIYGSDPATLKRLRAFQGGRLRSQQVALRLSGPTSYGTAALANAVPSTATSKPLFKDLLPPNEFAPDTGCERRKIQAGAPERPYCFDAGDSRANEQISLATLHTIWMREHNRLAEGLAQVNPHWQDERLFQEARKLVSAQVQHITFGEFLPLIVGARHVHDFSLELSPAGSFYLGYEPAASASVRVEFQAAAFRYGHSLVPDHIERYNKFHQKIESVRLSKLLKQPFDLYFPGVLDTYIAGLADQHAGRMDAAVSNELVNHLFERPGQLFGLDLAAINIQRGRDLGVRGYTAYREFCGLFRASNFEDLTGSFDNRTLARLAALYKHVDDIDLFTGGIAEFPLEGALVGPTFACLISKQVALLRQADRFWYESPGQFSLEQLDEIRRHTSAARLLCDNSDDLQDMQASAMLVAEPRSNRRRACNSFAPLDLNKWAELPQSQPKPQPLPLSLPPRLTSTGGDPAELHRLAVANFEGPVPADHLFSGRHGHSPPPLQTTSNYHFEGSPVELLERELTAALDVKLHAAIGQRRALTAEHLNQEAASLKLEADAIGQFVDHLVQVDNFRRPAYLHGPPPQQPVSS